MEAKQVTTEQAQYRGQGGIVNLEDTAMDIDTMVRQLELVRTAMARVMREGEHYGRPFEGAKKPTLLKPGAEILGMLFRLDPQYKSEVVPPDIGMGGHLTVKTTCTLYHIPTGNRIASGEGSCSTREAKYAWRDGGRTCPNCGAMAIIRGKEEWGGGWICFKKKGGCGQKFANGDQTIESQRWGRVANEDLGDEYNTVLKMANKRAHIAATLGATACSDLFTQDLEEAEHENPEPKSNGKTEPSKRGEPSSNPAEELLKAKGALIDSWSRGGWTVAKMEGIAKKPSADWTMDDIEALKEYARTRATKPQETRKPSPATTTPPNGGTNGHARPATETDPKSRREDPGSRIWAYWDNTPEEFREMAKKHLRFDFEPWQVQDAENLYKIASRMADGQKV
jgi:hypothetical protein